MTLQRPGDVSLGGDDISQVKSQHTSRQIPSFTAYFLTGTSQGEKPRSRRREAAHPTRGSRPLTRHCSLGSCGATNAGAQSRRARAAAKDPGPRVTLTLKSSLPTRHKALLHSCIPMQGIQIRSLVGAVRPHMLQLGPDATKNS